MQRFYSPIVDSDVFDLPEVEAKHCVSVLRKKPKDQIEVVDGQGRIYVAEILNISKRKCEVKVLSKQFEAKDLPCSLHIAIAPTKNAARFEWFLEKSTEIGIDKITPIICQRSERKKINTERANKVLITAMKQSLKSWLPSLEDAVDFSAFIQSASNFGDSKFIGHCVGESPFHLKNEYKKGSDALVLIGPEGDFSNDEIALAQENGFTPISLGTGRLRTETAGIVSCSIFNLMNE
jgi:16S rRNA (uracil1498-N3)-methyltransferase